MKDVFVSYSHSDKEFTDNLSEKLVQLGVEIWKDSRAFNGTTNMVIEINEGLKETRYGLIILSEHYLRPGWTMEEFSALMNQKANNSKELIFIAHALSFDYIQNEFPLIAPRFILNSELGIENLAKQIQEIVSIEKELTKPIDLISDIQPLNTLAVIEKENSTLLYGSGQSEPFYFLTNAMGYRYVHVRQMSLIHKISEGNIIYNAEDQRVVFFHGNRVVSTELLSHKASINGIEFTYNHQPSIIYENRTYLSLITFTDLLGSKVIESDSNSMIVIVQSN